MDDSDDVSQPRFNSVRIRSLEEWRAGTVVQLNNIENYLRERGVEREKTINSINDQFEKQECRIKKVERTIYMATGFIMALQLYLQFGTK